MFQGSENLGKMEFIKLVQSNGGILNGSTRFDFTNYFEVVPAHALETALWAEADRMKGLAINAGQPQEPAGGRQERGPRQRAEPAVRRLSLARPAAVRQHQLVQRPQLLRRPEGPRRRDARGRRELLQDVLRAEQRGARRRRRLRPGADDGLDQEVLRRRSRRRRCRRKPDISEPQPGQGEAGHQGRPARDAPGPRHRLPRARRATRPSTSRWGSSTRSSSRARTAASTRRSSRRTA